MLNTELKPQIDLPLTSWCMQMYMGSMQRDYVPLERRSRTEEQDGEDRDLTNERAPVTRTVSTRHANPNHH